MQDEKPSATAWRVAVARAAHQVLDHPKIFDDPLALRIVGAGADGRSPATLVSDRYRRSIRAKFLRAVLIARSRIAEDALVAAFARGVRQYVVLGAGLDTFAYRHRHAGLHVFEVDHPATQAWKRTILGHAGIPEPESLNFVAVDFERQTAMEGLRAAGFDRESPAFFAWLGVTMYLREEVVYSVLREIASLPSPSGVAFDYALASSELSMLARIGVAAANRRLTREGEPWLTFFKPHELDAKLREIGFREVHDWSPDDINTAFFGNRSDGLRVSSVARVVVASA